MNILVYKMSKLDFHVRAKQREVRFSQFEFKVFVRYKGVVSLAYTWSRTQHEI